MNFEKALELSNSAVKNKTGNELDGIQINVLQAAWNNETYESLAKQINYEVGYLKTTIGPNLWKLLSDAFQQEISKKNFRSVMMVLESDSMQGLKSMDNNEEIKRLQGIITSKNNRIKDLEAKLNEISLQKEGLEETIKSILHELDKTGINLPSLQILKERLQKLNVEENIKTCSSLEEIVSLKQNSWAEEAGNFALDKYPELTNPGGAVDSPEKRNEFYNDLRKYLKWITFGLSKFRILDINQVAIDRTIPFKPLYRDSFKFIRDEKTLHLEAKESEMLKSYLNTLIDFLS